MEFSVIKERIYVLRGYKVMLDKELAELYGVETRILMQAVRRNLSRFPHDFMFQLKQNELNLISQFVISSSQGWGGTRKLPFAFTEHGIAMLSSVLKSETAVQVNIAIIRAFVLLKQYNSDLHLLQKRINEMESKFNRKIEDITEIIEYLTAETKEPELAPRKKIGYKVGGK
jgi:hypothetical protein